MVQFVNEILLWDFRHKGKTSYILKKAIIVLIVCLQLPKMRLKLRQNGLFAATTSPRWDSISSDLILNHWQRQNNLTKDTKSPLPGHAAHKRPIYNPISFQIWQMFTCYWSCIDLHESAVDIHHPWNPIFGLNERSLVFLLESFKQRIMSAGI